MSLRDEIQSDFQRPSFEVRVAGRRVLDVMTVTVRSGLGKVNGSAAFLCKDRPSWADETAEVEAWLAINGQSAISFKGDLAGFAWEYFPKGVHLEGRDPLYKTRFPWAGEERVYADDADNDIIINLLEASGIALHNIPASEWDMGTWVLGTIQDVVLRPGQTPWSLIQEIDDLSGMATFSGPNGAVYRRPITGAVGHGAVWEFVQGVDILEIRRRRTSIDGAANSVLVKGLTYNDVEIIGEASADNPYIPNPPGTILLDIQSDLVEDAPRATSVAQRLLANRNRRDEGLELTVLGNPLIWPASVIKISSDAVEAGEVRVFVEDVAHTWTDQGGATTTLQTTGGTLSGVNEGAPIAIFALTLFQEAEDTGTVTPLIVGVATSASFDPDGSEEALEHAWTVTPTGGAATVIGTDDQSTFRFTLDEDVTSIVVELVVTDADGNSDTYSLTVEISSDTVLVEDLYTAEGATIAASEDGQQTWHEEAPASGNATCLAPYGPDWSSA